MTGTVSIFNVSTGDTKLVFDPNNPVDSVRAARIVTDMLKRGYILLADSGLRDDQDRPIFARVQQFDAKTYEYVIADLAESATTSEALEPTTESTTVATIAMGPDVVDVVDPKPRKANKPKTKRVSASSTDAYAVAKTAGG